MVKPTTLDLKECVEILKSASKYLNQFFDLLLSNSFQDKVKQTRFDLDIPINGFQDVKSYRNWKYADILVENKDGSYTSNGIKFSDQVNSIIEERSLQSNFLEIISTYILFGYFDEDGTPSFGCTLANVSIPPDEIINHLADGKLVFVIEKGVSKSDVINYIEKEWNNFPGANKRQKRIKNKKNRLRDLLIFKLHLEGGNEREIADMLIDTRAALVGDSELESIALLSIVGEKVGWARIKKIIHEQKKLHM